MDHNRIGSMMDAYCDFLIGYIDGESHSVLLTRLFRTTFVWSVPNDISRCEDGARLRDLFFTKDENYNKVGGDLIGKCNVLEVIIGIAVRMGSLTADIGQEEQMVCYFWELIDNLGLEIFSDDYYDTEGGDDEVDYVLEAFINRDYDLSGDGGLFPLKNKTNEDLTQVELWYQMSAYLDENVFKLERGR